MQQQHGSSGRTAARDASAQRYACFPAAGFPAAGGPRPQVFLCLHSLLTDSRFLQPLAQRAIDAAAKAQV